MIRTFKTEFLFTKGQKQAKIGDWEGSINLYDKALSLVPNYSGIYLHKSLSLSKQKKYTAAIEVLKNAISLKPNNPAYYLFMGIIYFDFKKYDDALINFEKTLEISPENYLAICFRCLTLLVKEEDINESLAILVDNIQNTNFEFQGRFLVLCESFLFKNKQFSKSLEEIIFYESYLKTKTQKAFKNATVLQSIVNQLNHIYFNIIYIFQPSKKNAHFHCSAGNRELFSGNISNAIIEFDKALNIYPDCDEAIDKLFDLCIYKKDLQPIFKRFKQIDEYKEIIDYFDSHQDNSDKSKIESKLIKHLSFVLNLGVLYYHNGDFNKAIELFNITISNHPNGFYPLYCLGLCYIGKKKPEEALIYFLQSMEKLNPQISKKRLDEMIRVLNTDEKAKLEEEVN